MRSRSPSRSPTSSAASSPTRRSRLRSCPPPRTSSTAARGMRFASRRRDLLALILGALVGLFILVAPTVMHLFAPGFEGEIYDLTVALSRILFLILLLLGIQASAVGILNSYERFAVFALAPLAWNIVIIAVLVGPAPAFPEEDRSTPTRSASSPARWFSSRSLLGPAQHAVSPPVRVRLAQPEGVAGPPADAPGDDQPRADQRQPRHQQPCRDARLRPRPAAIDKAFRIYMLPQGMFSVALTTVIFPTRRASPRAAPSPTCARRWPTGCARSSSCCSRPRRRSSCCRSRWSS